MNNPGSDSSSVAWERGLNTAPDFSNKSSNALSDSIFNSVAGAIDSRKELNSKPFLFSPPDKLRQPIVIPTNGNSNFIEDIPNNIPYSHILPNTINESIPGGSKIEAIAHQLKKEFPQLYRVDNVNRPVILQNTNPMSGQSIVASTLPVTATTNTINSTTTTTTNGTSAPVSEKKKLWLDQIVRNPLFIAIITGLVVMLILVILSPPFVKKKVNNPIYRQTVDPIKILVWGAIAGGAVYLLPFIQTKLFPSK